MTRTIERGSARERILHHAAQIASREGLGSLTVSRLADVAATSKSNVVERFGGHEQLQLATVDHAATIFHDIVVEPATTAESGHDRLDALFSGWMRYVDDGVFLGGCFLARVASAHHTSDHISAAVDRYVSDWLRQLERNARAANLSRPRLVAFEINAIGTQAAISRHATTKQARLAFREILARSAR